jgi:3-isopropylmalate dehydratase small subunit
MKKFEETKSVAAYIDRKNIDTDAIIPKQYLKVSYKRRLWGNFI